MAKVTVVLCDVKPCVSQAEREFEVNGQTLYVCGEQCFTRFWSREYWKLEGVPLQNANRFQHLTPMQEYETQEVQQRKNNGDLFKSELQIVKLQHG